MLDLIPGFNFKEVENEIHESLNELITEAAQQMFAAGKQMVDMARAKTRSEGSFNNITWNLRGSIGCLLVMDHHIKPEHIYFPPLSKGEEGNKQGEEYAREIALLVDDGDPVLVFVAGMDYAVFVEMKERDVITMSSLEFDRLLEGLK